MAWSAMKTEHMTKQFAVRKENLVEGMIIISHLNFVYMMRLSCTTQFHC